MEDYPLPFFSGQPDGMPGLAYYVYLGQRIPIMSSKAAPKSFETALRELETLVTKLESGDLSLEESLVAYRRGSELTRYCQQFLSQAEQVLQQLDQSALVPLDPNAHG